MNEETKKWIWWAIPVAVAVAIGAALYYGYKQRAPVLEPEPVSETEPVTEEPAIRHPIDEPGAADEPLPALAESDPTLERSLIDTLGQEIQKFLVPKNIVRHAVVTIDNLPRKKLAVQMLPVTPTPGQPIVTQTGEEITLDARNYARYAPLIGLLQRADAQQVASLYRRYYPLFQQAYVDQGYPDGYFNDRLVEVIDHLLETPEVTGPIRLTHPGMFYEFADPQLESRSAGQKILIRIGPENAAAVKRKLQELRVEVTKAQ